MARKSTIITSAVGAAAGLVLAGGVVLAANADDTTTTAPSTSTSQGANTDSGLPGLNQQGTTDLGAAGQQGQMGPGGHGGQPGDGQMGGSQDTAITGDEADKVVAAVQAKDSAASITEVRKDPDGSYDALGTKDGSPVFFEVSADLATITENTGGGMGGHGGQLGGQPGQAPDGTSQQGSSLDPNTSGSATSDSTAANGTT
ncbi:exported hypothetical protein [Nostocoides australiense Ben110]|uniref:PepSY domain-containing protein n=1 Tax=Nostocoides australiense Ben110 TaxID=1193182 RepID=W6K225_9MICO|nr:hypothetical protein [Tetrasphaera australiensis]CCH73482.1 exported hypothetical protein [Tetrasphaera australiensis Ben110]CCH75090.1 exported hypothetical protein [Tetrasphaera australiensis Ben110]